MDAAPRATALLLLGALALPLSCATPQMKRDLEAARSELAELRQSIQQLPQTVQQHDAAAWAQHDQQAQAMPDQLKRQLQTSTKQAADQHVQDTNKAIADLRAHLRKTRFNIETAVNNSLDTEHKKLQDQLASLRKEVDALRKQVTQLVQRARGRAVEACEQGLHKARAALERTTARVNARAEQIEKDIARLRQRAE